MQIDSELTYFIFSRTKIDKMRYTENWDTTKLEAGIDDIFVEFGGHICQQLVLYINTTYGYKLCFSSHRLVPVSVRGRLHKEASQEKRKEATPIL